MNLRKKLTYKQAMEYCTTHLKTLEEMYLTNDMTARKVAENQNIHYDNNFQRALLRTVGRKGKGLGGARPGSGNKKGVKFCPTCKKKLGNCNHLT